MTAPSGRHAGGRPSGHRVDSRGAIRGQPSGRPPNDTVVISGAGDGGGQPGAVTPTALRCDDDGLSPIHSPYYYYQLVQTPRCGKGRSVKFRCEREVLADALATAGRAATSRTGTLPVLAGLRLEVDGRRAVGHRHRPRAVDPADRRRRRRARRRRRRAGPPRRRHRALAAGRGGRVRARPTTRSASAPAARSSRPPAGARRLPDAGRAGGRGGHAVVGVGRRGAAPGRARGEHRRRPRRAHRRAASPPRTTACGWSPPTRTASPCATCPRARCSPAGQKVLVPSRALQRAAARARRRRASCTVRLGARDATFECGGTRLDDAADRGRVPELPQPVPSSYPNTLTVGRTRCSRRCAGSRSSPRTPRRCGCTLGGETLRLTAITQDVGNAVEELDATLRGHRDDRRRSTPTTSRPASTRSTPRRSRCRRSTR